MASSKKGKKKAPVAKKQPGLSLRHPGVKKTIYWALVIVLSVGLVVTFAGPAFFSSVMNMK